MTETPRATTARAREAQARESGWRSVRRAAALMLWQAAPWGLLVLAVLSVLGIGNAAWTVRSAGGTGGTVIVRGDQGVAVGISFFVGLALLFTWARTVRTAVPVLVAGGVTRRAVTGGLLLATTTIAVATTALLALVAVAGAALQRAIAPPARVVTPSDAYTSTLTLTTDASANVFSAGETLVTFIAVSLGGALLGAAWYRWRARGVVGVLLGAGLVWSTWAWVSARVGVATSNALNGTVGSSLAYLGICVVLAAVVWLVLRRVPLRPPAR